MIRLFFYHQILCIHFLLAVCSKPYEPHFVALDHERNKVNFFEYIFVGSKVSAAFENLPSKKDHVLKQGLLKGKKFNEEKACQIKLPMKLLNWKKPVLLCLFKNEWEQDVIKGMQVDIKGEGENPFEDDSFQEVVKPVTGFAKNEDASLVTGYIINSEFYGQVRLLDKHRNHLVVYYIEPVKNALLYDSKTSLDQVEKRKTNEDPDANAILFEYIAHNEKTKGKQEPTQEKRTTKAAVKKTKTTKKITTTTTPPVIHSTKKNRNPITIVPPIRSSAKPKRPRTPIHLTTQKNKDRVQKKVIHSSAKPPAKSLASLAVLHSTAAPPRSLTGMIHSTKTLTKTTPPAFKSTTIKSKTTNKVLHSTQSAPKKVEESSIFRSSAKPTETMKPVLKSTTSIGKKVTWFKSTKMPLASTKQVFRSTSRKVPPTQASLFKSSTVTAKPTRAVFKSTKKVNSLTTPPIFKSTSKKSLSVRPDFIKSSTQSAARKTKKTFFKSTKNFEIRRTTTTIPTAAPALPSTDSSMNDFNNTEETETRRYQRVKFTQINNRFTRGTPTTGSTRHHLSTRVMKGVGRRKRLLIAHSAPKSFKVKKSQRNRRRKRNANAVAEENIDDNDIIEEIKYPAGGKRGTVKIFDVNRFKKSGAICRLCIWIQPEFATNHGFLQGATYGAAEVVDLIRYINWLFRSMDFNMDYAPENVGFSIKQIVVADSKEVDKLADEDWKQDQEKVVTTIMKDIQSLFTKPCCVYLAFVYKNMQPYGSLTYRRGMCVENKNIAVISGGIHGHKVAKLDVYRFVVHALGHLMGALNDDDSDPDCNDATPSKFLNPLIMHPIHQINVGPRPNSMRLSYCARLKIATFLASGYSACFEEEEKPFCGNGVVEEGEECDCGAPWQCIFDTHPCCGIRDRFSSCKVIDMIPRGACNGPTVFDEDLDFGEE